MKEKATILKQSRIYWVFLVCEFIAILKFIAALFKWASKELSPNALGTQCRQLTSPYVSRRVLVRGHLGEN